jgi:acid-sensing ion channel, other
MRDFSHNFPWNPTNGLDILKLNFKIPNYEEIKFYNAFMIHPPDEPPLLLDKNNLIEFDGGREFKIMIIPNVITTDEDLISFDVDDRQCYLESEKYLRFFKIYSVKNCNVECFGNYSLRTCGCVPFDVVRDDEMPICNIHAYNCTDNLKYEMKFNFNDYSDCKCYPKCSTISYDFEIIENRLRE